MKALVTFAALACAGGLSFTAQAGGVIEDRVGSTAKTSMKQADDTHAMAQTQAKANEKSALAQCGAMSGDAKSQCKKGAEAAYKKAMADADAVHEKAKTK
jgi:hypothetical protein